MKAVMTGSVLVAVSASVASANVLASFSFSELDGTYDDQSSMFSAVATSNSQGNFARLVPVTGTALFDPGDADVTVSLSVDNLTATSADGMGDLLIRDVNGVEFTCDVDGGWILIQLGGGLQAVAFTGVITNAVFDGPTFEGTTGSFSTSFNTSPLVGAVIQLFIASNQFFGAGMETAPVELDGQLVPAPGVLALLGLGGLAACRRRRSAA